MVELAPIPVSGIRCCQPLATNTRADCVIVWTGCENEISAACPMNDDITCAAKTTQHTAMPTCRSRFIVSPISPPAKASVAPSATIATTEIAWAPGPVNDVTSVVTGPPQGRLAPVSAANAHHEPAAKAQ